MSHQAAPEYLTPPEVAAVLRLSPKSLYRLIERDPSLPVTRLTTGTLRFRRESLVRWLADQEQGQRRTAHHVRLRPGVVAASAESRRAGGPCADG